MNVKTIFKQFLTVGIGTILTMVISVITTPIITRLVTPEEYGRFSLFIMYGNIALSVFCLGLDQALVRYYYEENSIGYRNALLYKCVRIPLIIILACFMAFLALNNCSVLRKEEHIPLFISILFFVYTLILVIQRYSSLTVRLERRVKLYSFLGILIKTLFVVLAIIFLKVLNAYPSELLMVAITVSTGIAMLLGIIAQANIWKFEKEIKKRCVVPTKELIRYAYPYVFALGISSFFQGIDKMSLNYYSTYAEVGVYSSAMSIVNIFSILQTTFNSLYSPMALEHYAKDKQDTSFYEIANRIITVLMFFFGLTLILFKDIFVLLLGEKYREAACILPFLIFHPIMYTISETTVCGLVFMKKSKMQVVIAAISCLANLLGNAILVPIYGGRGAAFSTGVSYIIFFTLRTLISNRYFKLNISFNKFYAVTIITGVYAIYNTVGENCIVSVLGYIICVTVLLVMYKDTVFQLIQYGKQILSRGK